MKRLYIFILFCVCSFFVKAQYTLTSAIFPVAGDVEKTWDADTTGIIIGSAGTNQIWNYTGVVVSPTAAVTTKSYVAKTSAPNYTAFPSANLASTSDGITYGFDYYGTNITGYGSSDGTVTVIYGNPQTIASIPFTYGTISADTYSMIIPSSVDTQTITGSLTTTGDAWGTLNMPGGKSFPNTLRIKLQITQFGTVVATSTLAASYTYTYNVNNYVHLSSASKYDIFATGVSTITLKSGTLTNTYKDKNASVGEALFTGLAENQFSDSNFSLYPNPAANSANLWFVLTQNESYDMTITNGLGQVVRNKSYSDLKPGPYNLEVDLKGLQSGIYYVKLKGTKQEGVKKLIIE